MPVITVGAWTAKSTKKANVIEVRAGIAYGDINTKLREWDAATGNCTVGQKKDSLVSVWVPPVGKVKGELWAWLWSDGNITFETNDASADERVADPTQQIFVVDSGKIISLKEKDTP